MSYDSTAILAERQAQNTAAGGFTSGAWRTRSINTEISDTDAITSIASNRFTLQAGSYEVLAEATAYGINRHQCRLYNYTDSVVTETGDSSYANGTYLDSSKSCVIAIFTIASAKEFELQHRCETTKSTNGLGVEANFSTEQFSTVVIRKFA